MTGLGSGEGIAFPDSETILIGNGNTHAVKQYTAEGVFVEDIIPNGSGGLISPNAVVLRSSVVGLSEVALETEILVNNVGAYFEIRSDILQRIERVEVRDIKGSLVYQGRILSNIAWQANDAEKGTYFMTFFSGADSLSTQKVQVIF